MKIQKTSTILFPARAGVILVKRMGVAVMVAIPRTRGGDPRANRE